MTTIILLYSLTMLVLGVVFIYQVLNHWFMKKVALRKSPHPALMQNNYKKLNRISGCKVIPDTGVILHSQLEVFSAPQPGN